MLFIVQNDPDVPPGSITVNLRQCGVPYKIVKPFAGEILPLPEDVSAAIVLGGTMGANDDHMHPFLIVLKRWIMMLVDAGVPFLGICLGGQLLAAALGAKVHSNRWSEIGFSTVELNGAAHDDLLFSGMGSSFNSFQWHNDSFDLPSGALLLAGTDVCPHQAFRVGKNAWGVQFHPEVTLDIILHWSSEEKRTDSIINDAVTDWHSLENTFLSSSRQLLMNFLATFKP